MHTIFIDIVSAPKYENTYAISITYMHTTFIDIVSALKTHFIYWYCFSPKNTYALSITHMHTKFIDIVSVPKYENTYAI